MSNIMNPRYNIKCITNGLYIDTFRGVWVEKDKATALTPNEWADFFKGNNPTWLAKNLVIYAKA